MRGKNILWLCLIATLVSTMVVNVGMADKLKAKVKVLPPRIPEKPPDLGHPGEEYYMSIAIEDVADLYAFGFTVKYAPYVSVLVASDVAEGSFLSQGGTTAFAFKISAFAGTVKVGATLLGTVPGVSGSGTLMTFKMTVREAGDSPIELVDVGLVDSNGNHLPCDTWGSFYYGATGDLIRASMPDGRAVTVGEATRWETVVRNDGDVPLNVQTRLDFERLDDGRRFTLYAGQNYAGGGLGEPLPYDMVYLDEFNEWYYEWNNPATNALGTPDGAYIEGDANAQWASLYSFEDITLGGREIAYIEIEGYSQYPNGAYEGADIDLYGFSSVQGFAWLGSNYGTDVWGWHGVRWTTDAVTDVMPELRDEAELNGMELLIYNYYGDAPDVLRVDSMRLIIYYSPITPVVEDRGIWVNPGEELLLPDATINECTEDMIGKYVVTATMEYTTEGLVWNEGSKTRTFLFEIKP